MHRMIIMLPANPENNGPIIDFEEEYATVHAMPFFDVVLFDLANTRENGKLHFLQNPADHRAPAMYRGPRISTKDYKVLFSAAEAAGICMITDEWRYEYLHRFYFNNFHVVGEEHRDTPETRDLNQNASSSLAYSGMRRKPCRALSDSDTCKPCYFTVSNSEGSALVAKNLDADPRFIGVIEKLTDDCLDTLKAKHLNKSESLIYTNLIFQEYVRLKE